jgi:hypothetical protein
MIPNVVGEIRTVAEFISMARAMAEIDDIVPILPKVPKADPVASFGTIDAIGTGVPRSKSSLKRKAFRASRAATSRIGGAATNGMDGAAARPLRPLPTDPEGKGHCEEGWSDTGGQ